MQQSEQVDSLAEALAKVQRDLKGAKKDSKNPFFKSNYADLESCWNACRSLLSDNGLAVAQLSQPSENGVVIVSQIMHVSGQWMRDGGLFVPANKMDAQGFGSALTYARRYALCTIVGIVTEDDDGNAAAGSITARGVASDEWDALDADEQKFLQGIADRCAGYIASGEVGEALEYINTQKLTNEEKLALNSRFDSKQRTAMKKHREAQSAKV